MNFSLKHVQNQIVKRVRNVYLSENICLFCKNNCDDCHNYVERNSSGEGKQATFYADRTNS